MKNNNMDAQQFLKIAKILPPNQSVLVRGDHGKGKSQVVAQLAEFFNIELVDRRLAQMSEGDIIGLPVVSGEATKFNPPDWYVKACKQPVVLFLDELNRASMEVQQAAFEIVLDRRLNGMKLHPQTRVFAAVNTGNNYQVNEMDPALLSRFWVIDFEPSLEDWMTWAQKAGIHPNIQMFVQENPKFLDPADNYAPGSIQPTRRSWQKLNDALMYAQIADEPTHPDFFPMLTGFIGIDASAAFFNFAKNIDYNLTPEELLNNYDAPEVQRKISKLGQESLNVCIEKICGHIKGLTSLNEKQTSAIGKFMKILPSELKLSFWTKISIIDNIDIIKQVHVVVVEEVVAIFQSKDELDKEKK